MHRDTQIGLAMSIVLIGFAAALCFPRDSREATPALPLSEARKLDAEIERLPVRTYTNLDTATEEQSTVALRPPGTAFPPAESPFDVRISTQPAPAPEFADDPKPTGRTPQTGTIASHHPATLESADADSPTQEQELVHIVRSGDTLSGLAQQYLGSVARYHEIFEANQDVLETPDDLKLNMRLRIPRSVD